MASAHEKCFPPRNQLAAPPLRVAPPIWLVQRLLPRCANAPSTAGFANPKRSMRPNRPSCKPRERDGRLTGAGPGEPATQHLPTGHKAPTTPPRSPPCNLAENPLRSPSTDPDSIATATREIAACYTDRNQSGIGQVESPPGRPVRLPSAILPWCTKTTACPRTAMILLVGHGVVRRLALLKGKVQPTVDGLRGVRPHEFVMIAGPRPCSLTCRHGFRPGSCLANGDRLGSRHSARP